MSPLSKGPFATRSRRASYAPTAIGLEEAMILLALRGRLTNETISYLHGLDIETVRSLSRAAMTKLHTRSRVELMKAAKAFG